MCVQIFAMNSIVYNYLYIEILLLKDENDFCSDRKKCVCVKKQKKRKEEKNYRELKSTQNVQ